MATAQQEALEKYRQEIFRRKAEARVENARKPFIEKLAILDDLAEMDRFFKPIREQHLNRNKNKA